MKQLASLLIIVSMLGLAACSASETPAPTNTPVPGPVEPTEPPPTPTAAPPQPEPGEQMEPAAAEEPEPTATVAEAPVSDVRTFVIVPEQSQASYIVAEEFFGGALDRLGIEPGLTDTIGQTQEVTGEMQLDFGNLAAPVVSSQFAVNLESLTSDQSRRDQRIREANLESSRYPLAEFTITTLENTPTAYIEGEEVSFQALGEITIRKITLPTTFDVTATLNNGVITGVATTQLAMSDFGFDPPNFANLFSVANEFTAQVEFTFQQQ